MDHENSVRVASRQRMGDRADDHDAVVPAVQHQAILAAEEKVLVWAWTRYNRWPSGGC
jgi:hypothetical protein